MLDNLQMAIAVRTAISEAKLTLRAVADEYDVTEQAVSGWMRTGKIDKRKIPTLARLTGKPLSFFGFGEEDASHAQEDPATYATPALTEKERALLANYRAAGNEGRKALDAAGIALAKQEENPITKRPRPRKAS